MRGRGSEEWQHRFGMGVSGQPSPSHWEKWRTSLLAAVQVEGGELEGGQQVQVAVLHTRRELQADVAEMPAELRAVGCLEQQGDAVLAPREVQGVPQLGRGCYPVPLLRRSPFPDP